MGSQFFMPGLPLLSNTCSGLAGWKNLVWWIKPLTWGPQQRGDIWPVLSLVPERWGFPRGSVVENLPANAADSGDVGLIPGLGRFPEGGNCNPLQYSCLENSMDRGAWWATVHRVAKNWTWQSDWARMHTPGRWNTWSFLASSQVEHLSPNSDVCTPVETMVISRAMDCSSHNVFQAAITLERW